MKVRFSFDGEWLANGTHVPFNMDEASKMDA